MDDFEEMGRLLDDWEQEAELLVDKSDIRGGSSELDHLIKEAVMAAHGQEIKKWYDEISEFLDHLDNGLDEHDRSLQERYEQAESMLERTSNLVGFGSS